MNKIIYLGTTDGCTSCQIQQRLLETVIRERHDVRLKVCNHKILPSCIQINILLTDFPVTIFVENDVIKYHFVGTKTVNDIKKIMKDINY